MAVLSFTGTDELDRSIILATQDGLPLTPRPYEAIAGKIGVPASVVEQRLNAMLVNGIIRRIGIVPNHYRIGYAANGMSVWDVDDDSIDDLGELIGSLDYVTHCYRRPRHLPLWPYNLFAMVHGKTRSEVEDKCNAIAAILGPACHGHDILYSTRILKKTGLRLLKTAPGKEKTTCSD